MGPSLFFEEICQENKFAIDGPNSARHLVVVFMDTMEYLTSIFTNATQILMKGDKARR